MGMHGQSSAQRQGSALAGRDPISGDRVEARAGVIEGLRQEVLRLTSGQRWTSSIGLASLVLFLAVGLPSARVVADSAIVGTLGGAVAEEPPGAAGPTPTTGTTPNAPAAPSTPRSSSPSDPSLAARPSPIAVTGGSPRPGPSGSRPDGDPCTEVTDYEVALACISQLLPGGLPVPLPPLPDPPLPVPAIP